MEGEEAVTSWGETAATLLPYAPVEAKELNEPKPRYGLVSSTGKVICRFQGASKADRAAAEAIAMAVNVTARALLDQPKPVQVAPTAPPEFRYTPTTLQDIRRLARTFMLAVPGQVAKALGCPMSTLFKICDQHGIDLLHKPADGDDDTTRDGPRGYGQTAWVDTVKDAE